MENKELWVRCKGCGHKLFKTNDNTQAIEVLATIEMDYPKIEIKCSSCKTINNIYLFRS